MLSSGFEVDNPTERYILDIISLEKENKNQIKYGMSMNQISLKSG